MLILFDIDMTLLESRGVGLRSMVEAGQSLFGDHFNADGIAFGGQLDPLILNMMFERSGVEPTPEAHANLREAYVARLTRSFESPGVARALPGAIALLDALDAEGHREALGVLTGNFEESGRLKLGAAGIDPDRFTVHVWGDDSPHHPPAREHLPPVGVERHAARTGVTLGMEQVTLIGDTTHDVRAARMNGCRALGVATGSVSANDLRDAGADRVVDDLTDTQEILRWLTTP
ncbi:MAG: HAD family hydrolase [Phycisphaerales bacterium]